MANIKFPKKIFEKEIGKLDENMQNKIAMFGTTVEQITDEEIEIEVNPNRPDLLSYSGFKRSFLNFLEKTRGLKKYELKKPEKDYEVIVDSSVKEVRPYTACAIVKKLKLDNEKIKELIDIQEKLHFTVGRKRKELAKIFVDSYGISQKRAAKILGITEAAVSQYLKSKRGNEIKFSEKELKSIKKSAEKIVEGGESAMKNLYDLCIALRGSKIICKTHKSKDKSVPKNCDICFEN